MTLALRSRREVERRIRRLQDDYGDVPVTTVTIENDAGYFEHGRRFIEGGHVGGAGAVVRDDSGGILLGYHSHAGEWGPPAGGHEPGESLEETAYREIREETNVECEITDVFQVTRKRFVHAEDPERRAYLVEAIFEADYVSGRPDASDDDEILEAHWFDEPPADVNEILGSGSAVWSRPGDPLQDEVRD